MSWVTATWPLWAAAIGGVGATVVIAIVGPRLARTVDALADRTGLGEAVAGALLLASVTSIPGMVVSIVSAIDGNASLAITNSAGGIAAQTAFVVVADLVYRRANLEHAAASLTNLFYTLLILWLLANVVLATAVPTWELAGIHLVTPIMVASYVYSLHVSREISGEPMWEPTQTSETRLDEPGEEGKKASLRGLLTRFALLAATIAVAGWVIARAGTSVVAATALSGSAVGTVLTAVATSTPELSTTIAAVRAGALTLAVGGLVGGNAFDVLFIAGADIAYRDGAIYEAAVPADVFVLGWTMGLVALLGAGLLRRDVEGVGFEGVPLLLLYVGGIVGVLVLG